MKKVLFLMFVAFATMVSFSSCTSDDEREAMALSGEWEGDWRMWYKDTYGRIHRAEYTYIKLVPDYSYATHGYGYQEDYYKTGAYRYLWYKFDWSVKDGVLYLRYRHDSELDTFIRDYKLSNDYFSGYFGESSSYFRMRKLSDFYEWTPEIYVESDYYGWSLWSTYSKQYELGAGAKAYNDSLPAIVERGGHFREPVEE